MMSVISDSESSNRMGSSELLERNVERPVKRMTLEIPRELHAALKKAAAVEDRYIRDIVVEAVRVYLKEKGHTR